MIHTCRCGAGWTSTTAAHCAAAGCHKTFRNVTGFDDHRKGGACVDPAAIGLIEQGGIWATPEGHADRRDRASRLSSRNAADRKAARGTQTHPTPEGMLL